MKKGIVDHEAGSSGWWGWWWTVWAGGGWGLVVCYPVPKWAQKARRPRRDIVILTVEHLTEGLCGPLGHADGGWQQHTVVRLADGRVRRDRAAHFCARFMRRTISFRVLDDR